MKKSHTKKNKPINNNNDNILRNKIRIRLSKSNIKTTKTHIF